MDAYNNRSLFSDYYLEELVGEDSHWRALKSKVWEYRQRIRDILEKALPGINGDTPEAEVERRLIRPILDILGHVYFVQPAVPSPEGVRRPDYAFFPSTEVRREAEAQKGKLEFFKNVLAVGDAKAWERSLDKRVKGPGDPFTNHNPSYQVDFYLRATDKRWGLLTNGRHWRLYQRDLSYRLDVYYEVDLLQILTLDEAAFLYFLAFFHKDAFQPGGTGECFLDRAYRASTEYATKVSEELQDNVYEALRLLAEGFLSFPGNNLKSEELDNVRENAFIVIYRLLFILYAEARGFLPVTDPVYRETYSLRALSHDIATKEPFETKLHPIATGYWSRLQDLFKLINGGDKILHIPPYNGRLFDDQKELQCLATWKISDRYLAAAIDQLARARAAGRTGRGFVSYRDLSIRELGSIYEGLLEHRPCYAIQDVAVIKDDKREKFIPVTELGGRKVLKTYRAGSVYLETDKGERKATGSYYTPDYIVKYIVSNTVGPLIEEAKASSENLIGAILSLKVLDPAMGSGHFLVEAIDFLARALVEALGEDPGEMEEDEIRWARREVVERCIYGVDLNPLAVDLAKLSLWLSTVSVDKPLNFLDHHLRCGNSLIGARMEDLGILPGLGKKAKQTAITTLAGHRFQKAIASAVSTFQKIAETPSDSIEDIHRKESAYETARYVLNRVESIADVWISVYFGNEVRDQDAYERLLSLAEQDSGEWPKQGEIPWLDKGKAVANERHFFHWELEFPEVFFDRNGQRLANPGFSVVVGNPPYGKESIQPIRGYINATYNDIMGESDAYPTFMVRIHDLGKPSGRMSFIVPDTWLTLYNTTGLRKRYLTQSSIETLVRLNETIFPDPMVDPMIFIIKKSETIEAQTKISLLPKSERLEAYFRLDLPITQQVEQSMWLESTRQIINLGAVKTDEGILTKMMANPKFSDVLDFRAGCKPYEVGKGLPPQTKDIVDNKLYTSFKQESSDWLPLLRGDDICRYSIEIEKPEWIKYGPWLAAPREFAIFSSPRILIQSLRNPAITERLVATFADEVFITRINVYSLLPKIKKVGLLYALAVINSTLLNWALVRLYGLHTYVITGLEQLPIRQINFTTPKSERLQLVEKGKELYKQCLKSKDWGPVLSFVGQRLPQKLDGSPDIEKEQSDVIHDLLAFLVEEMTRLHKEKQAEIKGFLTWLEGYLGISIEDLKNKTKIREYWKGEAGCEGFLEVLEQNRRAIESAKGIDVTHREPRETIRAEFDKSIVKLKPILECIDLTDNIIDQIVYKLYGLTAEEKAVIEEIR
jgi:hypothetical protein